MQVFTYWARKDTYVRRPDPHTPGMMEHMFHVPASHLPRNVPSECNPRKSNIYKKAYESVWDSFKMKPASGRLDWNMFHVKNRGIVTLVTKVVIDDKSYPGWVRIDATIPPELGNVDGNHSYHIVCELEKENPEQLISQRLLEKAVWEEERVTHIAEGLNRAVQVSSEALSDQRGYFEPLKQVLEGYEYADLIGWTENEQGKSVHAKTIVSMAWVCNPLICEVGLDSPKHPNWIYCRAQSVFTNGFYGNENVRNEMLKIAPILPHLIHLYAYVNERAYGLGPKSDRKKTSKIKTSTGEASTDLSIKSLCVKSSLVAFRPPPPEGIPAVSLHKHDLLRECYLMIFLSGLRGLMTTDNGIIDWKYPWEDLYPIITNDDFIKKILKMMVRSLKNDKGQHDVTQRKNELWELVAMTMKDEVAKALG